MRVPIAAAGAQGLSLLREALSRLFGLPDFVWSLAGRGGAKKLRLSVVILRNGDGRPVASERDVAAALDETARVLSRQAGTELLAADGALVATVPNPAPPEALDAPCSTNGLWRTDLGPGGRWFRAQRFRSGYRFLGRGAPITVFVVHDVVGKCGCSLGPLGDYVTIDGGGLAGGTKRILAHELGHSCGLPHSSREDNLMRPRGPGERLTRLQRAALRSSRHVTYL
jgi:hypothetical protein